MDATDETGWGYAKLVEGIVMRPSRKRQYQMDTVLPIWTWKAVDGPEERTKHQRDNWSFVVDLSSGRLARDELEA